MEVEQKDLESDSLSDSSLEGLDSDEEDEEARAIDQDTSGLIPKPDGEAGRPGRGGYNLEQALGWEAKKYQSIKVRLALLNALWYHLVITCYSRPM